MSLAEGRGEAINLALYNYLGLGTHPEVIQQPLRPRCASSAPPGACGSPLLSGLTGLAPGVRAIRLAAFLQRDAGYVFNSRFSGALGSLAGLLRKGDVAIVDSKGT